MLYRFRVDAVVLDPILAWDSVRDISGRRAADPRHRAQHRGRDSTRADTVGLKPLFARDQDSAWICVRAKRLASSFRCSCVHQKYNLRMAPLKQRGAWISEHSSIDL